MKKYGVNMSIDIIGSAVACHVSRIFKTPDGVSYQKEESGHIIWYVWFSENELIASNAIKLVSDGVEYLPKLNNFIETYCIDKEVINGLNLNHEYMIAHNDSFDEQLYGFPISVNKFIEYLDYITVNVETGICTINADSMEELKMVQSQFR